MAPHLRSIVPDVQRHIKMYMDEYERTKQRACQNQNEARVRKYVEYIQRQKERIRIIYEKYP